MIDILFKSKEFIQIMVESLKIGRWILFKENNIDHITGGPYNPQHQGAVEVFNKTIQDFLISTKDHQGIFLLSWLY